MYSKSLKVCLLASVLLLNGCTSMLANIGGNEPVGLATSDRTVSQRMRDSGISKNALINLYKLDKRYDDNSRVSIHAFHDAVLVVGQVPHKSLIQKATESILEIMEVKVVHNELEVAHLASYGSRIDDNLIKSSIRKDLLLESGLKDSRIKVIVESGVVYLMGILSTQETNRVLSIVQKTNGIKKIISLIDNVKDVEANQEKLKAKKINRAKKIFAINQPSTDKDKVDDTIQKSNVQIFILSDERPKQVVQGEEDIKQESINKDVESSQEQHLQPSNKQQ